MFNEKKRMVDEMVVLEGEAAGLLKKRPFTRADGEKLKAVMARIKVNYVALGREDASEALRELDSAMAPLLMLLAGSSLMVNGMALPPAALAMLRGVNSAFTNLIVMFPMICMSQIGGDKGLSARSSFVPVVPVPVMGLSMSM